MIEETITQLDLMWDKIQELKQTDEFAAQCMYEKYKAIGDELSKELPPPIPTEAVSMPTM